ncbi:MAG: GNAT family N-acetyltransferase [Candidatus Wenzhouxiangella sp. M2_3B_020]
MLSIRTLQPSGIRDHLDELAAMRVRVFREYPYRYEGSAEYERDYLSHYARSGESVVVLAEHDGRIVGASTGLPLADADAAFRLPFERAGIAAGRVFYFGESVLLSEFRGRGIGHRFFDERERHARECGYAVTAFCAVDRAPDDPRRPAEYRPLDAFWAGRGYTRRPDLCAEFGWREIGDTEESVHRLTFWVRGPEEA